MGKRSHCRNLGWLSFTATLGGFGLFAPLARAEQFVVAEAAYTHSAQTTKDSHYRVKPTPETPPNWESPVDYTGGSVHVRLEVKTKPSDTPTRYQICFEMKQNYCCTDQAPVYTTPGVYEWDSDVEKLWRPGPVIFSQGIVQSALILKDTNNVKPAPENVGEATSALYMPTDLHVTVTVVSTGSTYQAPSLPTGGSGGAPEGGGATGGSGGVAGSGGAGMPSGGTSAGTPPSDAGAATSAAGTGGTAPLGSGGAATQPSPAGTAGSAATSFGPANAATADDGGCGIARSRSNGASSLTLAALAAAFLRRRLQARASR